MGRVKGIVAVCLLVLPAYAIGAEFQTYVGKPYATLHARLVSAGYAPFRILRPGSPAYRMALFDRNDVYARYREVEGCAGTGLADCEFVLARRGDIIVVHTTGEDVAGLVVAGVRHCSTADAERLYRQAPP